MTHASPPDRATRTVYPSVTRQLWRAAVAAVAETVKATLPPCNGRLERAVTLVLGDDVALHPDGTATVASQQSPTTRYTVNGQCDCPDAPKAPQGWCKHRLATQIARQATTLTTQGIQALEPSLAVSHALHPATTPSRRDASTVMQSRPRRAATRKEHSMTTHHLRPEEEAAVQEAVEQAERACQEAIAITPAAYRGFVTFIRQHKKVAGTQSHPVYAAIRLPYMGVDGRVTMAIDDHRAKEGTLTIETQFATEPVTDQLVCKATVTSSLLGSVTAHARVFVNGKGVDANNPLENAETSAVGRALGFLGYGLFGHGIASAEEVLQATAVQAPARAASTVDMPDPPVSDTTEGKPPSDRQLAYLRNLLEQTGGPEEEITTRLAGLTTSQEASTLIDQLRAQRREHAA